MSNHPSRILRRWHPVLLLPILFGLGACGLRSGAMPVPPAADLPTRVRALLASEERSGDFHRTRVELETLGPDVDTVLVGIVYDRTTRPLARANAMLLLSERRLPQALPALQWALFNSDNEVIREAAVLGLNRFVGESPEAQHAIRSAVQDPSPRVRLNALQSLDVHDINAIRAMLRTERHSLVREIAVQYLAISESRGAPLLADADGNFRTAALEHQPRLVLRPESGIASYGFVRGELGLEMPGGGYVPLGFDVEMVQHVLPAFLSPDRSVVVLETGRTIVLRDLVRREAVFLGAGLAPRLIPFSDSFVFLRESAAVPVEGGVDHAYDVFRAEFNGTDPERLGEMRVHVPAGSEIPYVPVRWMTVGENVEGWVIKVDGVIAFQAPHRTILQEYRAERGENGRR